jgi:alkanesulfonate monooxygenase SsuD/methylene tetrahydromethanopterin reductase-like flavin-dependent oxidoreductase (luciferase family)
MRLGVILPTFQHTPQPALDAAARAAAAGLDGVFCYDHLWPMGSPDRPALAPFEVLCAVASRHDALDVGTLVARIGLVAPEVLLAQVRALRLVTGDRLVVAMGTGDKLSREENLAYGIDYALPDVRRAELASVAGTLVGEGVTVWIGGGSAATEQVAAQTGATLNLWAATPERVAAVTETAVSWAGTAPLADAAVDPEATAALVDALAAAGATWAVFGAPAPIELLGELRARG